MKVCLDGNRLLKIGKDLEADNVDGESIGMLLFREQGGKLFKDAVTQTMYTPVALQAVVSVRYRPAGVRGTGLEPVYQWPAVG